MAGHGGGRIEFLIPGLFGPALETGEPGASLAGALRVPLLERLLARARHLAAGTDARDVATLCCHAFGLHAALDGDLPVAALTRLRDGAPADHRWWLRCDPIHLRVDFSDAVVFDWRSLKLDELEAGSLVATLNEHFAEDGLTLEALCPERWYLALDEAPRLRTTPLPRVAGISSRDCLPVGAGAARWRRLMNEAQMLLHEHPVNQRRAARGLPVINSVWPWGGGSLPEPQPCHWVAVCSDEPEALGLARHHRIDGFPGATFANCLAEAGGDLLVASGDAGRAAQVADLAAWRAAVLEFEERWLAPAVDALGHGGYAELRVDAGHAGEFRLTRRDARRWWRRRRPFGSWIEASAVAIDERRRA